MLLPLPLAETLLLIPASMLLPPKMLPDPKLLRRVVLAGVLAAVKPGGLAVSSAGVAKGAPATAGLCGSSGGCAAEGPGCLEATKLLLLLFMLLLLLQTLQLNGNNLYQQHDYISIRLRAASPAIAQVCMHGISLYLYSIYMLCMTMHGETAVDDLHKCSSKISTAVASMHVD